jgi:uncharacterized repeat protein (TIGR03837 family)
MIGMHAPLRWDLFCRVIDNFGDIGVCWRLAADLGLRGQSVRLWVDDASALAWMAPQGAPGVQCLHWTAHADWPEPGDVVIEAFGCHPPPAFVAHMVRLERPPLWINLEYLSAEAYVQRNHGLRSPQLGGPGQGLDKWFFYPGFEPGSGGLIREPGLLDERQHFDGRAWLQAQGLAPRPDERVISLFCYAGAPVGDLLRALDDTPTLMLVTPGAAAQALQSALARTPCPSVLRCIELPWFSQRDYDRLLWCCDLNFVRGEDSLVRAIWAGMPFVWQIYPQHDAVHAAKLDAFLDLMLSGSEAPLARELRALWRAWNGLHAGTVSLPSAPAWQKLALRWRQSLLQQQDLGSQLLGFVTERR